MFAETDENPRIFDDEERTHHQLNFFIYYTEEDSFAQIQIDCFIDIKMSDFKRANLEEIRKAIEFIFMRKR